MKTIRGHSADDVWREASRLLSTDAAGRTLHRSRSGDTHELLHVGIEIEAPRQRWVLSRRPAMNPAFAIAETVWILAGSNDAAILNYWFPGLPRFAGTGAKYAGAYGHRLVHHFGLDQVQRACDVLAGNPGSRQVVLQLWDARQDLPEKNGEPAASDVPCNLMSILQIRDGRLDWTQIMRSNDVHRGLPYNLVQFTILHELMAGWLDVAMGSYHHWADSLHAYVDAMDEFSCAASSIVYPGGVAHPNVDSLATDRVRGEKLLADLFQRLAAFTAPTLSEGRLMRLAEMPGAPVAYQNLLRVLAAEAARRRAYDKQAERLMSGCTNPQLVAVWRAWYERVSRKRGLNTFYQADGDIRHVEPSPSTL